jgi:hypothetical protein
MKINKLTLDDTKIIKTEPRYLCEACFKQKCNCNKTFKRFINWINKQLLRSVNIVKHHWDFLVVECADDMGLTLFGKWFLRTMMFGVFICYIPIVVVFIPLFLVIFKYDESLGM